jgi:hypothetical protein
MSGSGTQARRLREQLTQAGVTRTRSTIRPSLIQIRDRAGHEDGEQTAP